MCDVTHYLMGLGTSANADFQAKLIPGVPRETMLGVRTPDLRQVAHAIRKDADTQEFLAELPHRYFDENNLHALLLNEIKGFDRCLAAVEAFLPYVDNWATCDTLSPKCFGKNAQRLPELARRWMASGHVYTRRFGIAVLMRHFLTERFDPQYLAWVAAVPAEEYYVHMMVAWYFATALAKQYDAALPYVAEKRLPAATRRKAIQKALESFRVTEEHKQALRALRKEMGER